MPLLYQPGTHWRYSYGFDILGCVAKKVTGVSPDAWLKQVHAPHTMYFIDDIIQQPPTRWQDRQERDFS